MKTPKNYRETARVFDLQDSTVKNICKVAPSKKTNNGQSVFSKQVGIWRETKKEQESLYFI